MNVRWLMLPLSWVPLPGVIAQATVPACHVSVAEPPRRLELPDGRAVSTDVKSVAVSRGTVMAVGGLAYAFARETTPRTDPVVKDSVLGFMMDTGAVVTMVSNPPGVARALFPRIAPAHDGSFHAIFITTAADQDRLVPPADTATIWYAQYRHGSWTTPEIITRTRGARLVSETGSQLLERKGELSFVFPFKGRETQGLVLLRGHAGRWRFDTLRTVDEVISVDAVHGRDGTLIAGFVASGQRIDASFSDVVFISRFGASWSAPQYAGGGGHKSVAMVRLGRLDDSVLASWLAWTFADAESSEIHALVSGGNVMTTRVSSGKATYPFEALTLADRHPVWVTRGPQYGSTLSLFVGAPPAIEQHLFDVPFENPRASLVPLSNDRLLVLTMKQGKAPNEPMVASYATILQFRCPESVRRQ